jgi:fucose 4-O-acetylase-like acetyltransferase
MRVRGVVESDQIRVCRVVCIFFMMSVHINPGPGSPSLMSTGELQWLGGIWMHTFGRASVAALSFISGFLLVRTAAHASFNLVARKRFMTLIVPMLTWNLIFCLLQLGKAALLQAPEESALLQPGADILAELTGLTGPTANLSLFFLRDLFASALIVYLLRPALAAFPWLVLAALVLLTIFGLTEPLVYRPSILVFVAAGAAWGQRSPTLSAGLTPGRMVVAAILLFCPLILVEQPFVQASALADPAHELRDLLRRGLLVLGVLVTSALLVSGRARDLLVPLERRIFETYLLHVPLFGVMFMVWTGLIGQPTDWSYLLFFLLAPVAAIAAGIPFGGLCDRLPGWMQIVLRGKTVAQKRRTSARPGDGTPPASPRLSSKQARATGDSR